MVRSAVEMKEAMRNAITAVALAALSAVALAQTPAPAPPAAPPPAAAQVVSVNEAPPPADGVARRALAVLAGPAWDKARYFSFTFNVARNGQVLASFPQQW